MKTNQPLYTRAVLLRLFVAALAVGILFAAVWAPAQAARKHCIGYYDVVKNDTLQNIAKKFDVKWEALARINHVRSPYTLYIGQHLCIPDESYSDFNEMEGKPTVKTSGNFFVSRSRNSISINLEDFPEQVTYNVKVDKATDSWTKWFKIGTVHTNKDGDGSVKLALPEDLKNAAILFVCLKDTMSDSLVCRTVYY